MDERPRDDDILTVLQHAVGYEREVLIGCLAHAEGTAGVRALEQLYASTRGHEREAALYALAVRTRARSTRRCVEALRSTSFNLQERASMLLADFGDADAIPDVLDWVKRKLSRKSRPNGLWSPYMIPAAIRFGTRHGIHAQVAEILADRWDHLHSDEQDWLRRTWPGMFAPDGQPAPTPATPPPAHPQGDVYEDERGFAPTLDDAPTPEWWEEFHWAYDRAARRAVRARKK